jgi:hypothetical protein
MITAAIIVAYTLIAALVLRHSYPMLSWDEDTGKPVRDSAEWGFIAAVISVLWPLSLAVVLAMGLGQLAHWLLWPKGVHVKQEAAFKAKQEAEKECMEKERIARDEGWLHP